MSLLAKEVRLHLIGSDGYAEKFPGGIFAEMAPASVADRGTYGVYTGSNTEDSVDLSGRCLYKTETFEFVVTSRTVDECERVLQWVLEKCGPKSWVSVTGIKVYWWRVSSSGNVSEIVLEGSDEAVRQVRLSFSGAFRLV